MTSNSGIRVLADPFNETVGYAVPNVEADIVTTSHGHGDHNYVEAVKGSFIHLSKPGTYSEKGIAIKGIAAAHDEKNGEKRGPDTIFTFDIDGIKVCHCGDLGHILTAAQVGGIGKVDVLMIPVGGFYTIDYKTAVEVVKQLKPTVTIPMHYKTEVTNYPIATEEKFLEEAKDGKRLNRQELDLTKENIDGFAGVVVFNYK